MALLSLTPHQLIYRALKDAGIAAEGVPPSAEAVNDGYLDLQLLLAEWQTQETYVYHQVDVSIVSTGAQSYTVGPTGDIVVSQAPDFITSGYVRQLASGTTSSNNVDYPLRILRSRDDYSQIQMKKLTAFGFSLFLDKGFPNATAYCWPLPQAAIYELHMCFLAQLGDAMPALDTTISLEGIYLAALRWTLAERFPILFGMGDATPQLQRLAAEARTKLRSVNTDINTLSMPSELTRRSPYNIFTDNAR